MADAIRFGAGVPKWAQTLAQKVNIAGPSGIVTRRSAEEWRAKELGFQRYSERQTFYAKLTQGQKRRFQIAQKAVQEKGGGKAKPLDVKNKGVFAMLDLARSLSYSEYRDIYIGMTGYEPQVYLS